MCNYCNETNIDKLSIDHINGGGRQHLKQIGINKCGHTLYNWLIQNNYPNDPPLQVLCHNCQTIKRSNNNEHKT